jgi:hypothetical protein
MLELFYLLGFESINLEALAARFKFSSSVRKFLEKAIELYQALQQKNDYIYFCLLIDRSLNYLELIKYFLNLDLIAKDLAQQIINSHAEFPMALLSPKDVISMVPAALISKTLADVRVWQIRHKIHDRNACLDYVENNLRAVK